MEQTLSSSTYSFSVRLDNCTILVIQFFSHPNYVFNTCIEEIKNQLQKYCSFPLVNKQGMIVSLQHRPTAIYCLHRESGSNGKASFLDVHVTRMGRDVSCQVLEICWQHRDECWDVGIMGSFPSSTADQSSCPIALFYIMECMTASPLPFLPHCQLLPGLIWMLLTCSLLPSTPPSPVLAHPFWPASLPCLLLGWM